MIGLIIISVIAVVIAIILGVTWIEDSKKHTEVTNENYNSRQSR